MPQFDIVCFFILIYSTVTSYFMIFCILMQFVLPLFFLNKHILIIYKDAPRPWQIGFQDTTTLGAESIQHVYADLLFCVFFLAFTLLYLIIRIAYLYNTDAVLQVSNFTSHSTKFEWGWTLLPSIFLCFLALQSFTLIYSLDYTDLNFKVDDNQRFWNFKCFFYKESINNSLSRGISLNNNYNFKHSTLGFSVGGDSEKPKTFEIAKLVNNQDLDAFINYCCSANWVDAKKELNPYQINRIYYLFLKLYLENDADTRLQGLVIEVFSDPSIIRTLHFLERKVYLQQLLPLLVVRGVENKVELMLNSSLTKSDCYNLRLMCFKLGPALSNPNIVGVLYPNCGIDDGLLGELAYWPDPKPAKVTLSVDEIAKKYKPVNVAAARLP